MTRVALITTTINVPMVLETYPTHIPSNVHLDLIVAGDVQTPPEARHFVEKLDGTYLDVTGELVERWESNGVIGTRSIQRRNIALLHALTLGPDIIITVDDDNYPLHDKSYISSFIDRFDQRVKMLLRTNTGWYNPGRILDPPVVHRGFPLSHRHITPHITADDVRPTIHGGSPPLIGVVAGLWYGDPDIDAIERIVNRPNVYGFRPFSGHREVTLAPGTWAPFNTQNTAYDWHVAPLMQCLVCVGRYDDIWMSYIARVIMDDLGWHVHYGEPLVRQKRNDHDLLRDLENELYGYRNTGEFVERLRTLVPLNAGDPLEALRYVYESVNDIVPEQTSVANEAWLHDVFEAVSEGEERRRERSE